MPFNKLAALAKGSLMVRWLRRINYRVDHKRFMEAPGLILDIYGTNYIFFFTSYSACDDITTSNFAVPRAIVVVAAVKCIPSKYTRI